MIRAHNRGSYLDRRSNSNKTNNVKMFCVLRSRSTPLAPPCRWRNMCLPPRKRTLALSALSITTPEILGETIRPKSRRGLIKLPRIPLSREYSRVTKRIYDAPNARPPSALFRSPGWGIFPLSRRYCMSSISTISDMRTE